ncbi:hypothetical protein RJD38_11520 [Vibrio scophthalmi]|uniref:Uncharacterized protein n=1 Tax=Vibrio scophthalmi TaxID=45658 RepID=A0A1C7FAK7_9VIBR|nr:hypothetical protein [Vibrio scophthalmi]ANU36962.1 hypothetical protein VSVS05_01837 [Vibrio scophthalmi]
MFDTLIDHLDDYVESLTELWIFHIPAPILVYYFALSSAEKADVSWLCFPLIMLTTPVFVSLWDRKVLPLLIIAPILFGIGYAFLGGPEFSSFYFLCLKWIGITVAGCVAILILHQVYMFTAWLVRKILSVTIFYNWFTMLISAVVAYQIGKYVFTTYEDTVNLIMLLAVPFVVAILFFTGGSDLTLRSWSSVFEHKRDGMSTSEALDKAEMEQRTRERFWSMFKK